MTQMAPDPVPVPRRPAAATDDPVVLLGAGSGERADRDAEFTAFVAAHQGDLLRTAWLLCGDGHRAEELTQALEKNVKQFGVEYVLIGPQERATLKVGDAFWSHYRKVAGNGSYVLLKTNVSEERAGK